MTKKDFGSAVQAILSEIINKYCTCGEESVKHIVDMLNVANDMSHTYNLKELEALEVYRITVNRLLKSDSSKYRIISESNIYKLVVIM